MAKGVIQASVLTADGSVSVAGGASIEIRDSATNALRTLYTDRTGSTTTGNPLTADSDGWFQVYADVGRVNIIVDDGTTQRTAYNIVVQDSGIEVSTLGTMITEDAADYPLLAGGTDADFTAMPWVGGASIVGQVGIGVSQTWQDVSGTRADATTYSNTTGAPIMVMVVISYDQAGTGASIIVDSTTIQVCGGGSTGLFPVSFIVPPGADYSVDAQSSTTTNSIFSWHELKY